jgi:hypothetical protein
MGQDGGIRTARRMGEEKQLRSERSESADVVYRNTIRPTVMCSLDNLNNNLQRKNISHIVLRRCVFESVQCSEVQAVIASWEFSEII